jgi:alkylated DNA nucleotide flippase Atl1
VTPIDFRRAAAFVDAVPCGRWTSFGDVAAAAGSDKAAQAVGQWLMREGDRFSAVHRVLRATGEISPGFRPAGPAVPGDAAAVRALLEREGVHFSVDGRASAGQRFRARDWRG